MKKMVAIFALCLALPALFAADRTMKKPVAKPDKILIAFFSYSGNTRFAAKQLQKITGGTLFEIVPVKPYPQDSHLCTDQARLEIRDKVRPALVGRVEKFEQYTIVFVGSPTWWRTIAPPVSTFLSSYDFTGKIIVPFSTHGGSGMKQPEKEIAALCPRVKVLKNGAFYGSGIERAEKEIANWVNQSILLQK